MSSDDPHGHDKEPIILTSPRRFGKGLVIVIVTIAIGAGILIPFFNQMAEIPPPVTQIRTEGPAAQEGEEEGQAPAEAGTTAISILQGAAVQGSPDYDPDAAQVPVGNSIVWDNQDTVPHTATSGTGPQDPNSAQLFDTSIINGGEESTPVELQGVSEGQTIPYYCIVHPYMTSELTIVAGGQGGGGQTQGGGGAAQQQGGGEGANQTGQTTGGGGTAAPAGGGGGPTINILEGSSIQGNPDYDPEDLTASAGAEVTVVNQDTLPHTVTSGTGPQDPNSAQLFDTSLINGGESATLSLAQVTLGQYDYYCIVHPYMTGKLNVQ
ncbi:MAG: plastocyanin/azurin family copper-binding protein [Thermoproteota archaeon]|nr:plastocyanin/azurin family copper-binding protein [Thermoproteota archaeon]